MRLTLLLAPLAALFLAGCADLPSRERVLSVASKRALDSSCLRATDPGCRFANAPVQLDTAPVKVPGRNVDFFAMKEPLFFDNSGERRWVAPRGTLTDGASIPAFFIPVIGDPSSPEFALASAMHDAYCGVGNEAGEVYHRETWQDVHLMFHDALVASGTGELRAKVMFAAVWIAGPRWNTPDLDLSGVPISTKIMALQMTLNFIEKEDPDLSQLVAYMDWLDGWMIRRRIVEQHIPPDLPPLEFTENPQFDPTLQLATQP